MEKENTRKDEEKYKNGIVAIEATHPRHMVLEQNVFNNKPLRVLMITKY
jgi:hypothetical protein